MKNVWQMQTIKSKKESLFYHVKWGPFHHGMARPQVADGGDDLQDMAQTADKGCSSSLELGRGANNSP
jgi:hypothetical protein